MQKQRGSYLYSPSDLVVFMESGFASWMDRFALEFPGLIAPDQADEQNQIFQTKGSEHERAVLAQLRRDQQEVCEIPSHGDRIRATADAMHGGRRIIYQAALSHNRFAGYADFLSRVEGTSTLGDYYYEVWDAKLALSAKPYFIVQLCCYAEMLEALQGKLPEEIQIVLGDGATRRFRTEDYFYYYRQLKKAFLAQQAAFNPEDKPAPIGFEGCGRWSSHASDLLEASDHVSRIANIRAVQIQRLERAGIRTLTGLANATQAHIPKMLPDTYRELRRQAKLQLESTGLDRPKYEALDPDPLHPRRGLALLPPPSPEDVWFDMEGYPLTTGGLEYLFGATYVEGSDVQFRDWWAHDRPQERVAFESFIDWISERRRNNPAMHIYHYAPYEVTALRRLMGRFGTREREVDDLLRNEIFVDLYTVVRQSLRIGEPAYSLKNIEHLYADARQGEVATAADSMVFYQRWLMSGPAPSSRDRLILEAIRNYNREDCESTWRLTTWLRQLQKQQGMAWIPKPARSDEEEPDRKPMSAAEALARRLLDEIPHDRGEDAERWRVQELLAWLLEFHRREDKPVWWAVFDRHQMTEDQLVDDVDCLGRLERTPRQPMPAKQSSLYEYRFDPGQDTRLNRGSRCFFAHDLRVRTTIEEFDPDAGLLSIKLGPKAPMPPDRLSLIPHEHFDATKIADSIFRTVNNFSRTGELPEALQRFFYRQRPEIRGNPHGPILPAHMDPLEGTIQAVINLENSTLCIQGPPGTGKTFTAARTIVELLRLGKRVGIASNSHKAIAHLMNKVAEQARSSGTTFRGVKVGGDPADLESLDPIYGHTSKIEQVFGPGASTAQIIGGTAWTFSDEKALGGLDYLFVDEAGQVSIANLVGMSQSTSNIVVIGDQMQLGQPIKGSHPGETGQSVLEYLLGDHATIPDEFGIFLGTSWRMHPDVCDFISGAVYDDRLQPESHTASRALSLPGGGGLLRKASGILYVPVHHEGNSQASDEEVAVVRDLVRELMQGKVRKNADEPWRGLTFDDILIVAPFNMQVLRLKEAIPGARVGTVDKFQGQEGAVVIVSMSSSSGDASARGMEFLFSRNRLNVAISRAEILAIVVANPALARTKCSTVEQMRLANLFCRVVEAGS